LLHPAHVLGAPIEKLRALALGLGQLPRSLGELPIELREHLSSRRFALAATESFELALEALELRLLPGCRLACLLLVQEALALRFQGRPLARALLRLLLRLPDLTRLHQSFAEPLELRLARRVLLAPKTFGEL